jgi:hypothetical protein
MADLIISSHARYEMTRRGIPEELVRSTFSAPEQQWEIRPGRDVLQSRVKMGPESRVYLLRLFVEVDREPHQLVTVYRTSKISKYWR